MELYARGPESSTSLGQRIFKDHSFALHGCANSSYALPDLHRATRAESSLSQETRSSASMILCLQVLEFRCVFSDEKLVQTLCFCTAHVLYTPTAVVSMQAPCVGASDSSGFVWPGWLLYFRSPQITSLSCRHSKMTWSLAWGKPP